jgi:hypothetical protein
MGLKLKAWKPDESGVAKATVHKSGKLGFSKGAMEKMNFKENKYITIAFNEENPKDTSLYLIAYKESTPESIRISKAGAYFYINMKQYFIENNIDYQNKKIIYDIVEIEYEGQKIYKLARRDKDRKNQNNQI